MMKEVVSAVAINPNTRNSFTRNGVTSFS
jgi:hypothetical protein